MCDADLKEIVDGKPGRKQRFHRLCTKDRAHPTSSSKAVRRLCDEFMATINAQVAPAPEQADLSIAAFWEHTYLPFIKDNLKPSTHLGYQQVWNQHLKDHFANMTLREYRKGTNRTFNFSRREFCFR
jgi:hypothetical protein